MYVRYPLSPHNVEDLLLERGIALLERGIDLCHETVRMWWKGAVKLIKTWFISVIRGLDAMSLETILVRTLRER